METPAKPLVGWRVHVSGQLYWDSAADDESRHAYTFDASVNGPVPNRNARLIGAGGIRIHLLRRWHLRVRQFGGRLIRTRYRSRRGECMQRNCTRRFPRAIDEGDVTIVTFGDSVPVVGDAPMFPHDSRADW